MAKQTRAHEILSILKKHIPLQCALCYRNPFELAVSTILSAQCTDKRVNMTTPYLFREFPTAETMAIAPLERIEEIIRSTGFYRNKAKNIQKLSQILINEYDGKLPETMEELIKLPGIARKTANVILTYAFDKIEGITVDTHVLRVSERLGFSKGKNAVVVEKNLMKKYPKEDWPYVATCFVIHGRLTCFARKPDCAQCTIKHLCPSSQA